MRLSAFHDRQPRAAPSAGFGTARRIAATVRATLSALTRLSGDKHQVDRVASLVHERFQALRPAIAARLAHGHVRDCHGDLHLCNIAWLDGAALPFDCLEFNSALRWTDTMSDVAPQEWSA